jgi:adenine-specific DNA methylase
LKVYAVSSHNKKAVGAENGLPTIKCPVCGKEILLVPNVKLMSEAIEAHVETHKQKIKDPQVEKEVERIREDLIAQVLEKASKS